MHPLLGSSLSCILLRRRRLQRFTSGSQLNSRYVNDSSLGSSSTLTDDPILPGSAAPPTNAIMAIVEKPLGGQTVDERARIAIVSVVPETGEVIWDEFDGESVVSQRYSALIWQTRLYDLNSKLA